MQELEQIHGSDARNVPSTSHVGAAGLEMGTRCWAWTEAEGCCFGVF